MDNYFAGSSEKSPAGQKAELDLSPNVHSSFRLDSVSRAGLIIQANY